MRLWHDSMLDAISADMTYAEWWRTVQGVVLRPGHPGRDEWVMECQSFWRSNGGKFCRISISKEA